MIHLMPSVLTVVKKVDLAHILIVYPEHIVEQRVRESTRNKYF